MTNRQLRVFLCHSSNDKSAVRDLYDRLLAEGWIDPWLDEKKLLPGQDWDLAIEKAVEDSHAVIICLSQSSVTKEGYIQKELRFVLDIALTKPEEEIFVVPLRLEDCQPPRRLRAFHYVDYFPKTQKDAAYQYVLRSLKRRAESLNIEVIDAEVFARQRAEERARKELEERIQKEAREKIRREMEERLRAEAEEQARKEYEVSNSKFTLLPVTNTASGLNYRGDKITFSNGMEFMRVPAGKFLMGEGKEQRTVDIPYDYWMARFPVTNEQYNLYVKAKGNKHPVSDWEQKKNHPVVNVNWYTANEYSQWLTTLLRVELLSGMKIRLPSEAEWEKAARGTDGREYPWGNTFDINKCNSAEGGKRDTTFVGNYSPQGDSPYGCADMAGNVWEWTHSEYKAHPYNAKDGREDEQKSVERILRGGSWNLDHWTVRCAFRDRYVPDGFLNYIGFRLVVLGSDISVS